MVSLVSTRPSIKTDFSPLEDIYPKPSCSTNQLGGSATAAASQQGAAVTAAAAAGKNATTAAAAAAASDANLRSQFEIAGLTASQVNGQIGRPFVHPLAISQESPSSVTTLKA